MRKDARLYEISIHALRGEGDGNDLRGGRLAVQFLSTPSVGRATGCFIEYIHNAEISIHALRGEGDLWAVP